MRCDFTYCLTHRYLAKKGFMVLSKSAASGLTQSWNMGYHVAVALGYRYVFFANNDVLVPRGALEEMKAVLAYNELAVPLTTTKGAGHHPGQVIFQAPLSPPPVW